MGRFGFHAHTLSLGDEMELPIGLHRFIKVTPKGFNFLNVKTNRVALRRHLYMKGMAGKSHQVTGPIKGTFFVPSWFHNILRGRKR